MPRLAINEGTVKARHIVEVLVEDVGFEDMKARVVKPLEGLKIAGYVGCQTNRRSASPESLLKIRSTSTG